MDIFAKPEQLCFIYTLISTAMKKLIFLLLISAICLQANAQYTDTVFQYFDIAWKEVDGKEDYFSYFRIALKTEKGPWHVRDYYSDTRTVQMEGLFLDDSLTIKDGKFYYYYYNGNLKSECTYNKNTLVGLRRAYSITGQLIDSSRFKSTGIPFHKVFQWDEEGRLIEYGEFDMNGSGKGTLTGYYEDSTTNFTGQFAVGHVRDSTWSYFNQNGKLCFREHYDSGKLISYQCFNDDGSVVTSKCDTAARLPESGYDVYQYMYEDVRMPKEAINAELRGRFVVIVAFVVERDGRVSHPYIELGSFDYFNNEALRVVRTFPRWKQPGKHHNRTEQVHYQLPVTFQM